jgi:hypothetical protein
MVTGSVQRSVNNRLGVDYRQLAAGFARFDRPIIDAHAHIHGKEASGVYAQVQELFGVGLTYSMTQLHLCADVREVMGDRVRFMCIPTFSHPDKGHAFRAGYLEAIEEYHRRYQASVMKIWSSPRLKEIVPDGARDVWAIDSEWRVRQCELAVSLGMKIMVHIADPDTWYQAKWNDAARFGTKRSEYESLERMLERFKVKWIAAHCGGWPEDLEFLTGLLARHANLHLDLSATKWMVRELSKHSRAEFLEFLTRHRGRILFGSDIVTLNDHVTAKKGMPESIKSDQASSPEQAFDLYASRYFALRTMFERTGDMESPIADEDLKMVEPGRFDAMSAPMLRGFGLPREVLEDVYICAAEGFFGVVSRR